MTNEIENRKVVVILSGGMDSATLLAHVKRRNQVAEVVTFDYGQRHGKEIGYARELATHYNVRWNMIRLPLRPVFEGSGSSQVDEVPVPHGHYADENMKVTVVPYRNLIMLSVAAARARSLKADCVASGAHTGDHTIYPDCRPEFVTAVNGALALGDWETVEIVTPFIDMSKGDICARGVELEVPFHLTWSCYEGGFMHCGKCGACTERKEAFEFAGITDPMPYQARAVAQ